MAPPQTLSGLIAGDYTSACTLKLPSQNITTFPSSILTLRSTLELLDLSNNPLSTLPQNFPLLQNLKILFLSNCNFTIFPAILSKCRNLEIVAFKGNGMTTIPENSLPRKLRWLILTNNKIEKLPASIGSCYALQKCMLAGNKLSSLPSTLKECRKLGLLRLSCNNLPSLPEWLVELPELAFLSFAGNPCSATSSSPPSTITTSKTDGSDGKDDVEAAEEELKSILWHELEVQHLLGEGASGIISQGLWTPGPTRPSSPSPFSKSSTANSSTTNLRLQNNPQTQGRGQLSKEKETEEEETGMKVAIKLFHSSVTSDGSPHDEMHVCLLAGQHPNLIDPIGRIEGHPERNGLVLQLIPPHYKNLGLPPNFNTCTRDTFAPETNLTLKSVIEILKGIASAAEHLHTKSIAHGDLYAHNILINHSTSHALLGDFGAGTPYKAIPTGIRRNLEKLEVLAFGHLVEDLLSLCTTGEAEGDESLILGLNELHLSCTKRAVSERPSFRDVVGALEGF